MRRLTGLRPADGGTEPIRVTIDGGIISAIEPAIGEDGPLIVPGFIDLHCHGGGGADVMDGGGAVAQIAETHSAFGTTGFLATTMTAPIDEIERALRDAVEAAKSSALLRSTMLGVHLEGPFISPDRLGAQPNFPLAADLHLMRHLLGLAPIRVVTMAAEVDPGGQVAALLADLNIRVQLGHSVADYDLASARLCTCASGVTHLFNAMPGLHHRAPGLLGAALAHAAFAEIIPDLLHVHPGAIRAALRAIPGLYAVTDATSASGMPDGDYKLGRHVVRRCDNGVRLADGTLAGSCLTMHDAFRNLVEIGLSLNNASRRTAAIAANYLGLLDRGLIEVGRRADLVLMRSDLALVEVIVEGRSLS